MSSFPSTFTRPLEWFPKRTSTTPSPPRNILLSRQTSLNIPNANNVDTPSSRSLVADVHTRWNALHRRWKVPKRSSGTWKVEVQPGRVGIQFLSTRMNEIQIGLLPTFDVTRVTLHNDRPLVNGLLVVSINDHKVTAQPAAATLQQLKTVPRPFILRLRHRQHKPIMCRLCETLVESNGVEDHLQYCIMSTKSEANAEKYSKALKKIGTSIGLRLQQRNLKAMIVEHECLQMYETMQTVALATSECSSQDLQSLDTCSLFLKEHVASVPFHLNGHGATSPKQAAQCVVRALKYHLQIRRLIDGKMSAMRSIHTSDLQLSTAHIKSSPTQVEEKVTYPFALDLQNVESPNAKMYRSVSWNETSRRKSLDQKITPFNLENTGLHVTIDDFEIIKPISKGAFGAVYLAKKKATGDRYAIKVLAKEHVVRKTQWGHLQSERDILASAESPFMVKLYWTFESKLNLFLVMEYLSGGDLASLIDHAIRVNENVCRLYLSQVILALKYLHERGCVHRYVHW